MTKSSKNLIGSDTWKHLVRDHVLKSTKPLLVILGPTASGKTGFSLKLAHYIDRELKEDFAQWRSGAEIVNADSRQLYRGFDIGTAKITEREMDKIPHHLIDVLDPEADVSIAWYQKEAMRVIDDIHARSNVPILVGGSMLYISAIIDGLTPIDPADPALRAEIEAEYDQDRGATLHQQLADIDPQTAGAFHHHNKPYVVRATEIHRMTGKKPSEAKIAKASPYDLLLFGMHVDKTELDERIAKRTQELFDQGWIEEVERLLDNDIPPTSPAMKSTGYREIAAWLSNPESMEKEDLIERITKKTRQYAKRQMTWWKNDMRINWLAST
jgi:tRNA dimethylallyltransferase